MLLSCVIEILSVVLNRQVLFLNIECCVKYTRIIFFNIILLHVFIMCDRNIECRVK